jgi:Zn-dependent protease with chaperone function
MEYATWQAEAYGVDLPEFMTRNGASVEDWSEFATCFTRIDWQHACSGMQGAQMETKLLVCDAAKNVPFLGWYGLFGFFLGGAISVVIIQISTVYQLVRLNQGGEKLAENLGCLELECSTLEGGLENLQSTADDVAKQFNIPVPKIFVLHKEEGINAFVVGRRADDSVLVVTNGLRFFDDVQIRGILAHEFAHVQSCDMVHNMRLLAVAMAANSIRYSSECLLRKGWQWFTCPAGNHFTAVFTLKWGFFFLCCGSAMWPMGLAGSLISSFVIAKMNRKRELRADRVASRILGSGDPIAQAMRRILGHRQGSKIKCPEARRLAHLMFASASGFSGGMFSTHPSLSQRVRRMDRTWDGTPLVCEETFNATGVTVDRDSLPDDGEVIDPRLSAALENVDSSIVGLFEDAEASLLTLPAVLCFDSNNRQLVDTLAGGQYASAVGSLWAVIADTTAAQRFALLETVLKHVGPEQQPTMGPLISELSELVSARDWKVQGWLRIFADAIQADCQPPVCRSSGFESLVRPLLEVTSIGVTLSEGGAISDLRAAKIWAAAELSSMPILEVDAYDFFDLDQSVEALRHVSLRSRQTLLVAMADALSDGQHFDELEAAFLRYLAHRMEIPTHLLPQFLPTTEGRNAPVVV